VLAADARKNQARKKTASYAVSAAVAASPMWPSVTATAQDLSKEDAGKLAHKLKHTGAERVLLAYGDTDSAVAELQRALKIPADGIFGPQTRAAVKAFQKAHGLLPTGKVDVKTWLKLFPTDMVVYAPPGSVSALGVNDTDEPQWAAVSAEEAVASDGATAKAAASGKQAKKKHKREAAVHASSASIGTTGPPVTIPGAQGPAGNGPGFIPGVLGGVVAPNGGGGGGGGGGSFHFPPLSKFGSAKEMIAAMIRMANRIDSKHYAYRWGGGHNASFSGPYDCSGAVSAVLHAAGLLKRPMVSGEFMHWGAPGPGAVTIYANAGHVYMRIAGRYFGTTRMNPGGGAGWFPGAPRSGFAVVHVPFSKLHLKKHRRHKKKRKHRRKRRHHRAQAQGPLNQPATTAPPQQSGGTQAPPNSPPPSSSSTSTQQSQPAPTYAAPTTTSSPTTMQVAPAPNPEPSEPVQQATGTGSVPPAPSTPEAPTTPPAPSTPTASTPVGSGQGPSEAPNPPAAPQSPVGTPQGTQSGTGAPAGGPNQQPAQQAPQPPAQRPAPQASPVAQQAVTEGGQAVAQAKQQANKPAARPAGPPAGKGPQGQGNGQAK
jgi:hypothetical protein